MVFSEMPAFIKAIAQLYTDEDIRELQNYLLKNPESGDVIQGSGGVRKLRWAAMNKGKSGGARIIYFYAKSKQWIYLLFAYPKNTKINLTPSEKKLFAQLAKELS
jgi:hypothetical protein